MISFYLPCLAMLCIYYRLHRYARRQVESIKLTYKYTLPPTVTVSAAGAAATSTAVGGGGAAVGQPQQDGIDPGATAGDSSPSRYKMSDHKAAITLGIIMGVFLMSWTEEDFVSRRCPSARDAERFRRGNFSSSHVLEPVLRRKSDRRVVWSRLRHRCVTSRGPI